MKRRFRFRRLIKWIGAVVCVLILLAAVVCLRWQTVSVSSSGNWRLGVNSGAVVVEYETASLLGSDDWLVVGRVYGSRQELAERWLAFGMWPRDVTSTAGAWSIRWLFMPLWILFALMGVPTALLWWLDRRRRAPGCCARCGYNLTGNVTGRCSECGTSISQPAIVRQQTLSTITGNDHSD